MILCDIGNTTYHFLIDGMHKRYFLDEKLPEFKEKIYYISVNENAAKTLEKSHKNCINLEEYLSFETKYKGMGVDRKVVCLGVKDAVIVDAGSAITVDIMENYEHKGGFILPGILSLKKAYKEISVKLDYEINTKVNLDTIPLCTQDAISYSILQSIILPIKKISKTKKIIFTGGDGETLSKYFDNCIYKDDLIFKNMKGIIDANNCIA